MKEDLKVLNELLADLREDESLREDIDALKREVEELKARPPVVVKEDAGHVEKLRDRIKKLETENQKLRIKLDLIRHELRPEN